MKKISTILFAAAALLLTGCNKEQFSQEENLTTTFRISTDVTPATRATVDEDGASKGVNRFVMEVYRNHDGISELYTREAQFNAAGMHETTFTVTFLKDQEFDILFWADCAVSADEDLYYDTTTDGLKNVTFKDTYLGNDDNRDAFSAAKNVHVGKTALPEETIYLYRPFGQLNIITNDIDNLAETTSTGVLVCPDTIKVTFTGCNAFNVLTQAASGSEDFEYAMTPYYQLRDAAKSALADKYTLSMDYILASKDEQDIHTVVMTASQDSYVLSTTQFDNIPLQRNWRTNIYGALLTVEGSFEVIISEDWDGEFDAPYGDATVEPEKDTEGNYLVTDALELLWIAKSINAGVDFKNKTVLIENDIDLTNVVWTPVNAFGENKIGGFVLDGQGNTISNLVIDGGTQNNVGFFGSSDSDMTIKDIAFDNVSIKGKGNFMGTVIGYQYGNATLSNVAVTGSSIEGSIVGIKSIRIGGLVGYSALDDGAQLHLDGCSVEDCEFTGFHTTCGLVGTMKDFSNHTDKWSIASCSVTGCTFSIGSDVEKYVSPVTVDGTSYADRADNETYFSTMCECSDNTFTYNLYTAE